MITILKTYNGPPIFDDVREIERYQKLIKQKKRDEVKRKIKLGEYLIPSLPVWTNRIYLSKEFKINLFKLECTCDDYKKRSKFFKKRDVRKVCRHIYWKLISTQVKEELDDLTKLMLEAVHKYGVKYIYKVPFVSTDIYFGFSDDEKWLNVYAKDNYDRWRKWGYNVLEHRWSYNSKPINHEEIKYEIQKFRMYRMQ